MKRTPSRSQERGSRTMLKIAINEADDNTGVAVGQSVQAVLEGNGEAGPLILREVSFKAENGSGVTSTLSAIDLPGLVRALGLTNTITAEPIVVTPPAPTAKKPRTPRTPRKAAEVSAEVAPKVKVRTTPAEGKRSYSRRPDDLAEMIDRLGNSPTVLAEHYGVATHKVSGWLKRHRDALALQEQNA